MEETKKDLSDVGLDILHAARNRSSISPKQSNPTDKKERFHH